jgi:sugar phosphate isomerase/epimerase
VDNISYDSDPHIPIGKGKINFPQFLEAVHRLKPKSNMVIELPGIKTSIESRDLIQSFWDKFD